MKSLSKQTKSLHTLWPSGPNASPTVALYSNKCKKCTTHTLWLFYQAVIHHKLLCGSCCYYLLLLWCWIHIQDIMRPIQSVDGIWILEPWLQFFDQILRSRDPFSFWWDIEVHFFPPAEIEILHSGMSVSQSVFWPTLNQMLYFIPTTMSDSLK